ncbi:MAG: hypothetical protein WDZ41_01605 [Candidatus Babeliales bacterium]
MFIFLIILSSCVPQNNIFLKKEDIWSECEARIYDIPILIDAMPEKIEEKDSGVFISYKATLSLQDIVHFYEDEMERLGWQLFASFEQFEQLLIFEKPSKIAAISIRPDKNKFLVVLSVTPKNIF